MPVMTVVRVDPLKVLAEIPERMAPWIKVGQSVSAECRCLSGPHVQRDGQPHQPSGQHADAHVRLRGQGAQRRSDLLKPGTFARVQLETALVEQVLTIPYAAMQYRYGVNRAFVVEGDKLAARELKLGDRRGDRMEIDGGLKAGELVALTDVDNLSDGLTVTRRAAKAE